MAGRPVPAARTEKILQTLRAHLPELSVQYGVTTLELFGSYARGDQVVEFDRTPSLFEFVDLQNHLSDLLGASPALLGINVDLVMKDVLKPDLAPFILEDRILV